MRRLVTLAGLIGFTVPPMTPTLEELLFYAWAFLVIVLSPPWKEKTK